MLEKHRVKIKFDGNKIVCASDTQCPRCPDKNSCEDIDVFIESKYQGINDCMTHDAYKRKNGKVNQTRFGKR